MLVAATFRKLNYSYYYMYQKCIAVDSLMGCMGMLIMDVVK